MNVEIIATGDPAWQNWLKDKIHDVYHLPIYLKAEDDFRGTTSHMAVVSDAEKSLVVPLSFREIEGANYMLDASSPYGYPAPLATETADSNWIATAINDLLKHLRSIGVISLFLRFHPLIGVDSEVFASFGKRVEHGPTVAIALDRPFEDVRSDMRKGHRYDIRKALRDGQSAEWDSNWNHFDEFLEIYAHTMSRVGAGSGYAFSRKYFERLRDGLTDHVALWVTKINGEVAAASLITECGGIAQYHLSGTHPDFMAANPTKVLLDAVATWANNRGNRFFHLGGGVGSQEDSLFHFKAGFSKDRREFSTVRIVVAPEKFDTLVDHWEKDSGATADDLTGYFPPYRRPL